MYYPNTLKKYVDKQNKDFSFVFNLSHGRLYYSEPYINHGKNLESIFVQLEQDLAHFYKLDYNYTVLKVIKKSKGELFGKKNDDETTVRFYLPRGLFNKEIILDVTIRRLHQIDCTRFLYGNKAPLDLAITDYLIENNRFDLEELNRHVIDQYLIDRDLIKFGDGGLVNIHKRKVRFMLSAKTYFVTKTLPQNLFGIITYINLLLHVISESLTLVLNKNEVFFNGIKDYGNNELNRYKSDEVYRLILNPELKNPLNFKSNELYLYGVENGKRVL